MELYQSFRPGGPTVVVPAQPGPTGIPVVGWGAGVTASAAGDVSYLVYNPGTNECWLGYGATSGLARTNATVPVISGPVSSVPLPGGSLQTFTLAPNLFFAAYCQLGSASVYVTPGYGA